MSGLIKIRLGTPDPEDGSIVVDIDGPLLQSLRSQADCSWRGVRWYLGGAALTYLQSTSVENLHPSVCDALRQLHEACNAVAFDHMKGTP